MFQPVGHGSIWITGNFCSPKDWLANESGSGYNYDVHRFARGPLGTNHMLEILGKYWHHWQLFETYFRIFSERIHMIWWSCPTSCCNVVFRNVGMLQHGSKRNPVAGQKLHTPEAYFEGIPQKHMASSETGDTAQSGVVKQIINL